MLKASLYDNNDICFRQMHMVYSKLRNQAAKPLEPCRNGFPNAGLISKAIFALEIIGIGFMAIPVLAGSSAYAISDVFGLK